MFLLAGGKRPWKGNWFQRIENFGQQILIEFISEAGKGKISSTTKRWEVKSYIISTIDGLSILLP